MRRHFTCLSILSIADSEIEFESCELDIIIKKLGGIFNHKTYTLVLAPFIEVINTQFFSGMLIIK